LHENSADKTDQGSEQYKSSQECIIPRTTSNNHVILVLRTVHVQV